MDSTPSAEALKPETQVSSVTNNTSTAPSAKEPQELKYERNEQTLKLGVVENHKIVETSTSSNDKFKTEAKVAKSGAKTAR